MRMARQYAQVTAGQRQRLGNQLSQPPGAHQQHAVGGADMHLLLNFERSRQRLGEDRYLVWHRIGNAVQIDQRQAGVLGKDAAAVDNSQHSAVLTMGGAPRKTLLASAAYHVDVGHHALANPGRLICRDHFPDELVTQNTGERIISLHQFQVGAANPCPPHANERLAGLLGRLHLAQVETMIFQPYCFH